MNGVRLGTLVQSSAYKDVEYFADLPDPGSKNGQYYIVRTASGVWLINRHEAGFYRSDGSSWIYIGSVPELCSLQVGADIITAAPIILAGGTNVSLSADTITDTITISSTDTNTTSIKVGADTVTAQPVEFIAGTNVQLTPNVPGGTLTIAAAHNHDLTYLGIGAKAADSNKLDGIDSTGFSLSGHDHDLTYLKLDQSIPQTLTASPLNSSLTLGRIPFSTTNGQLIDDASLFWDNTNKRIGINKSSSLLGKVSIVPAVPTNSIAFTGTGLNDLVVDTSTATCESTIVHIAVIGIASPNTVRIRVFNSGGDIITSSTNMVLVGAPYTIPNTGIKIYWGATTGHTNGDVWTVTVTNDLTIVGDNSQGTTGLFKVFQNGSAQLGNLYIGRHPTDTSALGHVLIQNTKVSTAPQLTYAQIRLDNDGGAYYGAAYTKRLDMGIGGSRLMTIYSDKFGFFNIASPTIDMGLGGDADRAFGLERRTTSTYEGKGLKLQAGGATAGQTDKNGGDLGLWSGISTGSGNSNIRFYTATAGVSATTDRTPTEKVTILGSGNVGIGQTAPTSTLHIVGTTRTGGATDYTSFESDGTLVFNGTATVFNDAYSNLLVRTTGSGRPAFNTMITNISAYQFGVNDYVDTVALEFPHDWKEGTNIEVHVHWATGGLNDGTVRGVKWQVDYTWANTQASGGTIVYPATTPISAETSIAAAEAAYTNKYTSVGTFTPSGGKIGAQLLMKLSRIASVTNTAPANDPFCMAVSIHYECDTVGSRSQSGK